MKKRRVRYYTIRKSTHDDYGRRVGTPIVEEKMRKICVSVKIHKFLI